MLRTLLLSIVLVALSPVAAAQDSGLGPEWTTKTTKRLPGSLKKQIREARALLEQKDYVPLLEMLVHPEDRERMPSLEEVAEAFEGRKASALLEAFDTIDKSTIVKAEHSETKEKVVVIRVTEHIDSVPDDLVFARVDGVWRIRD